MNVITETICSNINMQHSRVHTGAAGENAAELTSTGVQVVDTLPINLKLELQV